LGLIEAELLRLGVRWNVRWRGRVFSTSFVTFRRNWLHLFVDQVVVGSEAQFSVIEGGQACQHRSAQPCVEIGAP